MDTHYDVVIVGAGLSGLAAGVRLAHFDFHPDHVCSAQKILLRGMSALSQRERLLLLLLETSTKAFH